MPSTDWLPDEVRTVTMLRRALAPHLRTWGEHWFGDDLAQVRELGRSSSLPTETIRAENVGGIIVANVAVRDAIAEILLGLDLRAGEIEDFDRAMLDDAVSTVLRDLLRRIDAPGDQTYEGATTITVALRSTRFVLCLRDHQINTVIKAALPCRAPKRPLIARERALRPAQVRVEAVAGTAQLNAEELADIAIGDVILLDRSIASGVDLLIAGGSGPIARAKLGQNDGRTILRVTQVAASR